MIREDPYWEIYSGDGPYLLLVHGFLSSGAQWQPNLDALSKFCRPVVMELYGHGRSPSPTDDARYRPAGYASAIDAIRERLGVERWFVCGYSLGAAITANYVLENPDRVRGHIMTNSSSAFAEQAMVDQWRATAEQTATSIKKGGKAAVDKIAVHPKNAKRLPESVKRALVEDARILNPEGIARTMQFTLPEASVRSRLVKNPVPGRLVCGRFEERFRDHRTFADSLPNFDVVDVDAGHGVNMEAVDAFNTAVETFIAAH